MALQVLQDESGQKWLKLRASSFSISKLVLGHLPAFKDVKNPSLASCPQFKVILDKIKPAVTKQEQEGEVDLFRGEAEKDAEDDQKNMHEMRKLLSDAPATINVQLGDHEVKLKTPKSWRESDIVVPLEAEALTRVVDFLMLDVGNCLAKEPSKRAYVKSGNFSKGPKNSWRLDSSQEPLLEKA